MVSPGVHLVVITDTKESEMEMYAVVATNINPRLAGAEIREEVHFGFITRAYDYALAVSMHGDWVSVYAPDGATLREYQNGKIKG
jgi:hypothetical protein